MIDISILFNRIIETQEKNNAEQKGAGYLINNFITLKWWLYKRILTLTRIEYVDKLKAEMVLFNNENDYVVLYIYPKIQRYILYIGSYRFDLKRDLLAINLLK